MHPLRLRRCRYRRRIPRREGDRPDDPGRHVHTQVCRGLLAILHNGQIDGKGGRIEVHGRVFRGDSRRSGGSLPPHVRDGIGDRSRSRFLRRDTAVHSVMRHAAGIVPGDGR